MIAVAERLSITEPCDIVCRTPRSQYKSHAPSLFEDSHVQKQSSSPGLGKHGREELIGQHSRLDIRTLYPTGRSRDCNWYLRSADLRTPDLKLSLRGELERLASFLTVPLPLIGLAFLASYLPAQRAARIDAARALRME